MRETGHPSNQLINCTVRGSLKTVREAYVDLRLLTGRRWSAATLASQIKLCDVLLVGISGIQAGLTVEYPTSSRGAASFRPKGFVAPAIVPR